MGGCKLFDWSALSNPGLARIWSLIGDYPSNIVPSFLRPVESAAVMKLSCLIFMWEIWSVYFCEFVVLQCIYYCRVVFFFFNEFVTNRKNDSDVDDDGDLQIKKVAKVIIVNEILFITKQEVELTTARSLWHTVQKIVVGVSLNATLANPKSQIFSLQFAFASIFFGFKSRWYTLAAAK